MAAYGSVAGALSYSRDIRLDQTNQPTTADAERFLLQQCATLNGWLAKAGYTIPVTQPDAKAVLDKFAEMGTVGLLELTRQSAAHDVDSEDVRENRFLAEFAKAEDYINSGALRLLGAEWTEPNSTAAAISFVRTTYGSTETDEYSRPPCWWTTS